MLRRDREYHNWVGTFRKYSNKIEVEPKQPYFNRDRAKKVAVTVDGKLHSNLCECGAVLIEDGVLDVCRKCGNRYENGELIVGKVITDEEWEERERCVREGRCQGCKRKLRGHRDEDNDDWHTPYWIPVSHGWYWCTECYGKHHTDSTYDHAYCPHNKDPHRWDREKQSIREFNEKIEKERGEKNE